MPLLRMSYGRVNAEVKNFQCKRQASDNEINWPPSRILGTCKLRFVELCGKNEEPLTTVLQQTL